MNSLTIRPRALVSSSRRSVVARAEPINPDIKKDEAKVVNMLKVSELPKKVRPTLWTAPCMLKCNDCALTCLDFRSRYFLVQLHVAWVVSAAARVRASGRDS